MAETDNAARRSPLSEHRYLKPLVLFLTIFFLNATLGTPGRSLFPVYVEKVLGGSPILTSTLFSLQNLVRIAILFIGGMLADRVGAKYLLLLGMTAVSLSGLMFMVSDTRLLVFLALLYGALFTLRTTSSRAYLALVAPLGSMGLMGALYFAGPTIGSALGNAAAGPIADQLSFRTLGIMMLVGNLLLVFFGVMFLPQIRLEKVQSMSAWEMLQSYRVLWRRPLILRLIGIRFLPTWWLGTSSVMLPLLIFRLTDSVTAVALYATVGALVTGSTGLVVGWLSDRIGRAIPVVASSLTLALGPFGCALFVDNALLLAASAIFTSLGGQWLASLMPSLVRVSGDGNEQGRLTAVTEAAWTFGNLGGTMAAGILIGLAAPLPFVLAGMLNVGTVLLALQAARILRGTDILKAR